MNRIITLLFLIATSAFSQHIVDIFPNPSNVGELRFWDLDVSAYEGFKADPTITSPIVYELWGVLPVGGTKCLSMDTSGKLLFSADDCTGGGGVWIDDGTDVTTTNRRNVELEQAPNTTLDFRMIAGDDVDDLVRIRLLNQSENDGWQIVFDQGTSSDVFRIQDHNANTAFVIDQTNLDSSFQTLVNVLNTVSLIAGDAVDDDTLLRFINSTGAAGYQILFDQSEDKLVFEDQAGVDIVAIDSNRRVGIRTASPTQVLHLLDTIDGTVAAQVENTEAVGVSAAAQFRVHGSAAQMSFSSHGAGSVTSRFGGPLGNWSEILVEAGNGLLFGTLAGTPIRMGTSATAIFEIEGSGNVGIGNGTINADEVFHVAKTADGTAILALFENSQPHAAASLNEAVQVSFGFGGNNNVAKILVGKVDDYDPGPAQDISFMAFFTDRAGSNLETMRLTDGNVEIEQQVADITLQLDLIAGDSVNDVINFRFLSKDKTNGFNITFDQTNDSLNINDLVDDTVRFSATQVRIESLVPMASTDDIGLVGDPFDDGWFLDLDTTTLDFSGSISGSGTVGMAWNPDSDSARDLGNTTTATWRNANVENLQVWTTTDIKRIELNPTIASFTQIKLRNDTGTTRMDLGISANDGALSLLASSSSRNVSLSTISGFEGLTVGGDRVVGFQCSALAVDATDLATALTLINELKDCVNENNHGLAAGT